MQKAPATPEEAAFTPGYDVDALLASPQFQTSSIEEERHALTTDLWRPLEEYAVAYAPLQQFFLFQRLCQDGEGRLRLNPILEHMAEENDEQEEAFSEAQAKLNDALTTEVILILSEALALVGVTDPATVCEVCRCVIRGGNLWDGKGFSPGQVPAGVVPDALGAVEENQ